MRIRVNSPLAVVVIRAKLAPVANMRSKNTARTLKQQFRTAASGGFWPAEHERVHGEIEVHLRQCLVLQDEHMIWRSSQSEQELREALAESNRAR